MRVLLVLLGLAVLALAGAMAWGIVSIDQTRPAVVQAPAFKADVGRVRVGSEQKTVTVPTVDVERAGNAQ